MRPVSKFFRKRIGSLRCWVFPRRCRHQRFAQVLRAFWMPSPCIWKPTSRSLCIQVPSDRMGDNIAGWVTLGKRTERKQDERMMTRTRNARTTESARNAEWGEEKMDKNQRRSKPRYNGRGKERVLRIRNGMIIWRYCYWRIEEKVVR